MRIPDKEPDIFDWPRKGRWLCDRPVLTFATAGYPRMAMFIKPQCVGPTEVVPTGWDKPVIIKDQRRPFLRRASDQTS